MNKTNSKKNRPIYKNVKLLPCPICGANPELEVIDMGSWHDGYPGEFEYNYSCPKCKLIKDIGSATICAEYNGTDKQRQAQAQEYAKVLWNKKVKEILKLSSKNHYLDKKVNDEVDETENDDVIANTMKDVANTLDAKEFKIVNSNDKKYILCGSCLPYEDELCDDVRTAFKTLSNIFGIELDEDNKDDLETNVSEIRDEILKRFEKMTNSKIVNGNNEY